MRAVNLIPADSRGGSASRGPSTGMQVPVYVLLGFLAAAVALVTIFVLTNNSISSRTAKLNNLKTEVTQEQAAVARLGEFTKFASLAQTRISTVQSIAAARFDWHAALSDLSKVVPANTTLQSVVGTVVPGATSGGSGSANTGGLRTAITAPAFELSGCTHSQDDVAKLMSQLRLIHGVTRVTISDSQLSNTTSAPSSTGSAQGCGANTPTFDLVVFFQPVANAGASGVTAVAGVTPTAAPGAPAPTAGTTTTTTTTTPGATTTTPGATTTPGTTTTSTTGGTQ
jgi:Tfp pilus assembly protein PilN